MSDFNTIALIGKYGDPSVKDTLLELQHYLEQHGKRVLLDEGTAQNLGLTGVEAAKHEQLGEFCDLAIIVGGDGTLLNAARSLTDYNVPLLGINLGRLGFLVDISHNQIQETLTDILGGNYIEDQRSLLTISVEREGERLYHNDAFNDVAVHKANSARMIELETYINGKLLYTIRADGLVVSTPTGSTAYAMSAGGPILSPSVDALLMVPICPHTMSNRPIVIDDECALEIRVGAGSHADVQITCDGQLNIGLALGDRLHIRRKDKKVRLLHPSSYDYFDILRKKLHWVARLT